LLFPFPLLPAETSVVLGKGGLEKQVEPIPRLAFINPYLGEVAVTVFRAR
jgi:hypothetical protein